MMNMSLAEAASSMNGILQLDARSNADGRCTGVSTDTRKQVAGTLFFALKGANHDGHDHVAAALAAGAAAAVVARSFATNNAASSVAPCIVVDDTLQALGRLAGVWRARCTATVIAITGNSGKTTTKEFTAAVLRKAGKTLATQGNLNNEIGVPLTLLQLDESHRFAVIEMGQGRAGDIAWLVNFTRPDIALVTNVTGAHLAGFGTLDAIAEGKGEVYSRLAANGIAIINADDAYANQWRKKLPACRVMTFGVSNAADVSAQAITTGDNGCARFTLLAGGESHDVSLQIPGVHNVANALAAAAIGMACGVATKEIAAALADVTPVAGRLVVRMLADGTRLIDDTYNANPGSVKAAINTLCAYAGTRVLVLGHMAELGPDAAALHRDVGEYARVAGVDALFATSDFSQDTVAGFDSVPGSGSGKKAQAYADVDALVAALRPELGNGVTVLVKGSRSARMERVVAALTGEKDAALAH